MDEEGVVWRGTSRRSCWLGWRLVASFNFVCCLQKDWKDRLSIPPSVEEALEEKLNKVNVVSVVGILCVVTRHEPKDGTFDDAA